MKKIILLLSALVLLCSHDMFLKLDTFFLEANTDASIKLFNGTFEKSDNHITRDRMIDVSLVGNGTRTAVDTGQWRDHEGMTILDFKTGEEGTWVAGVSTKARNIEMTADDFNGYLEHDGVIDMLEWRKSSGTMDQDAVEKYSKHVKTIYQVGTKRTEDWKTALGYPIEFIPQSNPYYLHPGDAIQVQLLFNAEPLTDQLVYQGIEAHEHDDHGHDHDHGEDDHHHHEGVTQLRTNERGMITAKIPETGIWYLRTIHLVETEEEGLTHESNWATLTFEVSDSHEGHDHDHADGHSHESDDHSHDHDHDDGHSHDHQHDGEHDHDHEHDKVGPPQIVYWIGALALFAGLFFWFNRKGNSAE